MGECALLEQGLGGPTVGSGLKITKTGAERLGGFIYLVHSPPAALPFLLFPCTVSCRIVFAKPEDHETCLNHLRFRFLTRARSSSYFPVVANILIGDVVPCMRCSVNFGSISSHRPVSFSLTLSSGPMAHKRKEIWI